MKQILILLRYGCFILAGSIAALCVSAKAGLAGSHDRHAAFKIVKVVSLGAPNRWDYLHYDPTSGRLYIAHQDRVTVVDGQSGQIVGAITGISGGAHGIVISHATDQGFTDDGKAGEAIVFDLKTLKITKRIKAKPDADGIIYDPVSRHIFVIDGRSGALTVIDPLTDEAVATVVVGTSLEFGVSGHNGKLYINGLERHEIVRVDVKTNKVDAHWPMPTCRQPLGMAIDRAHHRLFSACYNRRMIVMNTDNGAIVAKLTIGTGPDAARFDPKRQLVLSSNGMGTLSVIHEDGPDKYTVLPSIKTQKGARTMALDVKTGRVFLVAANVKINPTVPPQDYRHRFLIVPNSLKLFMLDSNE